MDKQIDFLAIGDLVVDDFIRLKDAEATCDLDQENCKLCVRFGDKVPYEFHEIIYAVGNSANAAVSASRLGLHSALSGVVGNDDYGKACMKALTDNNVSLDYIEIDPKLPTNYHYVLWYGPERTILVNHAPFERHFPKDMKAPKWIYLSSLGENTEGFHHEIAEWLKDHPETKLAFQPGTFQLALGKEKLKDVLTHTEVLCLNKEEAATLLETTDLDIKKLLDGLGMLGAKITLVTDGPHGAYMKYGDNYTSVPLYPDIAKPLERTGAGDAFCATFVSYLAKGLVPEDALLRAPINSMNVVQHVGAQEGLLHDNEIEEYLKQAPAEYSLKTI